MASSQPILQTSVFTPDKRACCGRSDVHMSHRLHRPEITRSPRNKAQRCLNLRLASAAVEEQVRQDMSMMLSVQPPPAVECYQLNQSIHHVSDRVCYCTGCPCAELGTYDRGVDRTHQV